MPLHQEQLPEPLPPEPLELVAGWLAQAIAARAQPNPNSMVLATVNAHGMPSARVVLCKQICPQPGYVTFFSNYNSRKGRELADNPRAAAVIHWDALRRQVRLEGVVTRSSAAESDSYFASRAWQSQLSAWASEQSEPIASRAHLQGALQSAAARFGIAAPLIDAAEISTAAALIPRPPHWGGYRLWPETVELWVEGSSRLHDRARWQRSLAPAAAGFEGGAWSATRLQP